MDVDSWQGIWLQALQRVPRTSEMAMYFKDFCEQVYKDYTELETFPDVDADDVAEVCFAFLTLTPPSHSECRVGSNLSPWPSTWPSRVESNTACWWLFKLVCSNPNLVSRVDGFMGCTPTPVLI